jgi:hypothetical protein
MGEKQAGLLVAVGGFALVVGSFLDWASVLGIGATGIDLRDGYVTGIGGAVLALAGWLAYSARPLPIWVGWLALIVGAGVAVFNFFDIQGKITDAGDIGTIGIGMWIMLAGSVAGLVGLLFGRRDSSPSSGGYTPPPES